MKDTRIKIQGSSKARRNGRAGVLVYHGRGIWLRHRMLKSLGLRDVVRFPPGALALIDN